jgi:acyl-CoA dehydrogenase
MFEFEFSPELTKYRQTLKEWVIQAVRPHAREADTQHAIPKNAIEILDTCPVPLDRIDARATGLPKFPDHDLIRDLVHGEMVLYGDAWLWESMSRGIGHSAVLLLGTPEQIERWHDPIARPGGGSAGFALTEPGVGSDTSQLATAAKRDGNHWVLNGSKIYCSRGADAQYIVVFATIDSTLGRSGIRGFVVERGTSGLVITKPNEDKLGLRSWKTTAFSLQDCVVPLDHQLGWSGQDRGADAAKSLARALSSFNTTRPMVGAWSLGIAQAALDVVSEQLQRERTGFAPIRWAKIQSELEQMNTAILRGRRLCYHAVWLQSQGLPNRREAPLGKIYGPQVAEGIIRRCMQLLGPDGASEELLIEKWYRDIKIYDIFEGTGQVMRVLASRELMGPGAAG